MAAVQLPKVGEPGQRGRPAGRPAEATRQRIQDAAEELLADEGYDGASIRRIAAAAGIAVAVVSYHFGAKQDLFNAVVGRRAVVMEDRRLTALTQLRQGSGNAPIGLDCLVREYVMPFFEYAFCADSGWRNYAVLMGRLSNSPRGTEMIRRHYDPVARAYLAEMQRALPQAPMPAVITGFLGVVSLMLLLCARTGRMDSLAGDGGRAGTDQQAMEAMIRFSVAGLEGLGGKH